MKEIIKDYISEIKDLFKNRKYLYTIIFIAILSYGFVVTHYAIGVDDLCFDRYVNGTYILSAKRWGTWLLYNVLNISEFSPFWLDFLTATGIVIIAILVSAFIKKETKEKNIIPYIVFSGVFISSPIINNFFMYQSTNLAIVVSNMILIVCGMLIYYNHFKVKNKWMFIIIGFVMTIPISMYESCAQTFIVFILMTVYIKVSKEKLKAKDMIYYLFISMMCLLISIISYEILGSILLYILDYFNIKQTNHAADDVFWTNPYIMQFPMQLKLELFGMIMSDKFGAYCNSAKIIIFAIVSILAISAMVVKGIKEKQVSKILIVLAMILTNFILIFMQADILFRMQFSWILTIAFEVYIIYDAVCKSKIKWTRYIAMAIVILLIVIQSRQLNQLFYNDYKRYEKEKVLANEIAIDLVRETNYKEKYIVYYSNDKERDTAFNLDKDDRSIIIWGIDAFDELAIETTDFINSLGYNFLSPNSEMDLKQLKQVYEGLPDEMKNKNIIELDEYIIVNLDKYSLFVE